MVYFNDRKHVETGDVLYFETGPGPILVSDSGRVMRAPGSTDLCTNLRTQDPCRVGRRRRETATWRPLTASYVPQCTGYTGEFTLQFFRLPGG